MNTYLSGLRENDDVISETTNVEYGSREEYEAAKERSESIDGAVVVGVTDDDGRVLLVRNDWMDGYGFPGGGVEEGEEWEEAAKREVLEETGVEVELDGPWRIRHSYHSYGDESVDLTCVFYRASPVGDTAVDDDPGVDAVETIEDVRWFRDVPREAVEPERINEALESA